MLQEVEIDVSFSSRWQYYKLHIKIGEAGKSKFRIAIERLPELLRPMKLKALMG